MEKNKENLGEESYAVKEFVEKVKDTIPFVKKAERIAEEAPAMTQAETNAPAKPKAFSMKPKNEGSFKEFMEKEGLKKLEERKRKKLEDAEKALADFENKYSEKLGQSQNPKDREAYRFKIAILKEEAEFIKKHFDLL